MSNGRKLAEQHWEWLSSLLGRVYIDAFEHGYKHGKDADKEWNHFKERID